MLYLLVRLSHIAPLVGVFMKNSVLAAVMLMMVLGFSINAFSAVSSKAVNARLAKLITSNYPIGLVLNGTTDSGKDCEIGIGAGPTGIVDLMVSKRTMMGTAHYVFGTNRGKTITSASENRTRLQFSYTNMSENREIWTIGLAADKSIRSVEVTEEVSGFFGTRLKSLVNCSL